MIYTLNPGSNAFEQNLVLNFQETNDRFHKTDVRFEKMDNKIDLLRKDMDAGFDRIDARFEAIDARFETIDVRFEAMDVRFVSLETSMNKQFKVLTWSIAVGFTMLTAMISVLSVLVLRAVA